MTKKTLISGGVMSGGISFSGIKMGPVNKVPVNSNSGSSVETPRKDDVQTLDNVGFEFWKISWNNILIDR